MATFDTAIGQARWLQAYATGPGAVGFDLNESLSASRLNHLTSDEARDIAEILICAARDSELVGNRA